VFSYYIKRKVKQTVWYHGQVSPHLEPGQRLALVAVDSKASDPASSPLFGDFEKRLGRSLHVKWSQVAHEVLLDNKDSLVVWVCEY
jgi:hypothetical protein